MLSSNQRSAVHTRWRAQWEGRSGPGWAPMHAATIAESFATKIAEERPVLARIRGRSGGLSKAACAAFMLSLVSRERSPPLP